MMRTKLGRLAVGVISLAAASTVPVDGENSLQTHATPPSAKELKPVASFDQVADRGARSIALFTEAGKVLQHPRCMNCHCRLAVGVISLAAASTVPVDGENSLQTHATPPSAKELKPVASFDQVADRGARSIALFTEAGKVLQHPRCMNCHPATERPTQTDWMRPHWSAALTDMARRGCCVRPATTQTISTPATSLATQTGILRRT